MEDQALYQLLQAVKQVLCITWSDQWTDGRLMEQINAGIAYINLKLGETADFEAAGLPRTLLFEYVRYMRDGALDVFENNYQALIQTMQHERMVAQYAAQSAESSAV